MRRRLALIVLSLGLVVGHALPAQAAWQNAPGYIGIFDRFTWDGQTLNTKSVYMVDRIGNGFMSTSMHQALAGMANRWNADLKARGLYGYLPAIAYYRDDAGAGQCSQGWVDGGPGNIGQIPFHEYSYVLACSGSPTNQIGATRGVDFMARYIRGARIFPFIFCSTKDGGITGNTLSIAQMTSCWAHEWGHLVGLPHNDSAGNLMNHNASGVLAGAWYPADAWGMLRGVYPPMGAD